MLSALAWASAWLLWQLIATSRQAEATAARHQWLAEGAQTLELAARWEAGPAAWFHPAGQAGRRVALTRAWQAVRHQPESPVRAWWPQGLDPAVLTWEDSAAGIRLCWPGFQGAARDRAFPWVLAPVGAGAGGMSGGASGEVCHEWR